MFDGKRILQIIAIICTVTWMSVIAHKGYNDISHIIKENPDNWGQLQVDIYSIIWPEANKAVDCR